MFEVGWCVTLYTAVLFLEFLPLVLERFRLERAAADAAPHHGSRSLSWGVFSPRCIKAPWAGCS